MQNIFHMLPKQTKLTLIRCGENLDQFINDIDVDVRLELVKQGYGLDILVNDDNPYIRDAMFDKINSINDIINSNNSNNSKLESIKLELEEVIEESMILGVNKNKVEYHLGILHNSNNISRIESSIIDLRNAIGSLKDDFSKNYTY